MEEADAAPRVRLELLALVKVINLSAASGEALEAECRRRQLDFGPIALA
jgi:hypothetical protein